MSDSESVQEQRTVTFLRLATSNRNSQNTPHHHQSSYQSASQSSSQPGTPSTQLDSYFEDRFSEDTPTLHQSHFDTILNTPVSAGIERFVSPLHWSSSHRQRPRSPTLSSLSAFRPTAMTSSRLPNGYVDLTHEPSSPSSPPMIPCRRISKRTSNAHSSPEAAEGPSTKRVRLNNGTSGRAGTIGKAEPATASSPIEEIDLVNDTNPLQSALQKQRVEQVKAQEKPSEKPLRLSNLTCVICMDTPTDITATSCGHLFCHTCLMEALIAGENRSAPHEPKRSQCPVCRKFINRNKSTDIISLLMKKGLATQPRKSTMSKTN
ncbi:hypothetical protein K432DRAFT_380304 [Lepidopterella palustris CBS 459.81]|uniref:RING-type domain-containing protein n=1 Tax=Lepidopterella palustris CBS 459.81 TaxID=1314670 RepID=A0A8E2EEZ6_9PEZI|nr:hypothetical protein K432DRAFT_380304 [Lepidopterella palustris CBS 459.81]